MRDIIARAVNGPAADLQTRPAWEIRVLRVAIGAVLIYAAVTTLWSLLDKQIITDNKLEVGLLLGWLIAKSGTVIDWLFGGSESGSRRADISAQQAATAPPLGSQQVTAPPDAKLTGEITTPAPEGEPR